MLKEKERERGGSPKETLTHFFSTQTIIIYYQLYTLFSLYIRTCIFALWIINIIINRRPFINERKKRIYHYYKLN